VSGYASSARLWIKVVGMLEQNWAVIEGVEPSHILFVDDNGLIFDKLRMGNHDEACDALTRNGFSRYPATEADLRYIKPPEGPFRPGCLRPIYSSGRFWR
jgi:hypothetical protein